MDITAIMVRPFLSYLAPKLKNSKPVRDALYAFNRDNFSQKTLAIFTAAITDATSVTALPTEVVKELLDDPSNREEIFRWILEGMNPHDIQKEQLVLDPYIERFPRFQDQMFLFFTIIFEKIAQYKIRHWDPADLEMLHLVGSIQGHIAEIQRSQDEIFQISKNIEKAVSDNGGQYFPIELVDQKIKHEVNSLRKSRFYIEFDTVRSALALAKKLTEGELSGGTNTLRGWALAWCSRILIRTKELGKAQEYLKLAESIGSCPEIDIAGAFILSQNGNKNGALSALAKIDLPISRTSALMVVSHHEDEERTIAWLKSAGIETSELDSEGKYSLITLQLKIGNWDDAKDTTDALTDQDLVETPVLYHFLAMTHLLSTVPTELRGAILNQLPFESSSFPLAADAEAINNRRIAQHWFTESAKIASQLNLFDTARREDEYALWLELRDPEHSEKGRQRLQAKLRDPKSALRLISLGLQFGIKLELALVEQEIDRLIALNGEITQDAAIARFALAFTQKTPEDIANYISRHYDELSKHYDRTSLLSLQIEMLSKAGFPERANECLEFLLKDGLSEDEERHLRNIISEAEGTDPVEARLVQFKQTDSLGDLIILVDRLESRGNWDSLCVYGKTLFERTRSVHDAERLVNALSNAHMTDEVVKLCKENADLLVHSKRLQIFYCWSLYHEGALLEARSELSKLGENLDDTNYRALQVNLGIALGDWHSLSAFIANEFLEKDKRTAQEMISAAQLAFHLGSLHAKELVLAAVAKGYDDAGVLSAAYFLATNAGWEDNVEVSQWLQKAAELSGDDGPIRKMTLEDLLARKPEWNSRESETWQLLSRGEVPQFLAAQSLNKSLVGLMLFPALANLLENDPRRKSVISVYSGSRQPVQIDHGKSIGIDATALLTLGFLNILDRVFDSFNEVYIPHSTLKWLFDEKQKVTFHQPSRIRNAHKVRDMIATDILEKLIQGTVVDSDLSAQVGDELALLISEAEKVRDDDTQRIVVRPFPVHRLNSLMNEEADLSKHAAVMSSCLSIVYKLRQNGQITAEEEKRAHAYLHLHEKPWPLQPEVNNGAILYLDDLAITYFLHLGLLEKLHAAGFRVIASPREVSEANELISYERISSNADEVIERIRSTVSSRIQAEKIKVGRRQNIVELEEQSLSEHPTVGVISLASVCDAIISDDRFFNQHENIDNGSAQASILSTLDVLDSLAFKGMITSNDRLEYRTLLRRAGYIFVPIADDELTTHLAISLVKDEKVVETAELKAIRENILQIRMSNWLQLPKEAPWLDMTFQVFNRVLKRLWSAEAELYKVIAYSNWILNQIDVRGWAHRFGNEEADNIVRNGRGVFILLLLTPPLDVPQDVKDAYWSWLEERVLVPIKEQNSELYAWILEWHRSQISEMADTKLKNGISVITPYVKAAIALATLNLTSPMLRNSLLEEKMLREDYGIRSDAVLSFNDSDVSIQRSDLYDAIRRVHSGASETKVIDTDDREWSLQIQNKTQKVVISHNNHSLILDNFDEFSPDNTIRLRSLDEAAIDVNLPVVARDRWQNILLNRAFDDDEMDDFRTDCHNTPVKIAQLIRNEFAKGEISISTLVPSSRKYFESLVGCFDGSASINEYAGGSGKQLFEQLSTWNPYDGLLLSLYLSMHSDLTAEMNVEQLKSNDFITALEFLEEDGDRISQLGAIEIGLRVLIEIPDIEQIIIRLIKQIRDDDINDLSSGFKILSALFILVDGELSRIRLFSAEPPFYRRLASLAQAALIHQQLVKSDVDIEQFCEWALNTRGQQYYFQSLADMRLEPRWNPDLASASQMKAEFIGRVLIAAKKYEKNINEGELYDLVIGTKPGSLNSHFRFYDPFFPGPLEGMGNNPNFMPVEFVDSIEAQLSAEVVEPSSFITLVNSALIYRIDSHHADLAAGSLKLGSYRLANVENKSQLLAILNGLAIVAAVARSSSLANELQILVRRYRHDAQYTLSIDEALRICLVAAASNADLNNWRQYVGDGLINLAFGKLEGNDGEVFHSHVHCLCHSVPELWVTCGRVDAALSAYKLTTR